MTTAAEIVAALRRRYAPPEWALAEEVYRSTGAHANERRADVVVMELFPSRGLHLEGFEVKVTRSDWLRELKQPHKVEQGLYRHCLHWWVVTPPGIVQAGELPSTWALMELKGDGRLHAAGKPPKLSPEPPTWGVLAALLRRATERSVPTSAVDKIVSERLAERLESENHRAARDRKELEQLQEAVDRFQSASGLHIRSFYRRSDSDHAERLGDQVRRFLANERVATETIAEMRSIRDHAARMHADCERHVAAAEREQKPSAP